ncbi:NAD(P)H-dependent oxidoreductase [bacterium]
MKITVLNGNPYKCNIKFDHTLSELSNVLQKKNHSTTVFTLRDMNIKQCVGCFGCWIQTPGTCVLKDESGDICRAYINADFVLFASPVLMGFTSALLKRANEKLLPLASPYFEFIRGEVRHVKRYKRYPSIGLLLDKDENTDLEDMEIITDLYKREAMNLKTSLCFTKFISDPIMEIENEINRI